MPMGCSESNGHTRHSSPLALGFSSGEIQPPVRRAFIGDRPTRAHIGADKRDRALSKGYRRLLMLCLGPAVRTVDLNRFDIG
jgi:hypothetical protein